MKSRPDVLIACECSGIVREAFRARGLVALSCDLKPAEDGSPNHVQGDALEAVRDLRPRLLIAHPVCRYMANSGAKHLYLGMSKVNGPNPERWANMRGGVAFFRALWDAHDGPKCFENPIMHGHAKALLGMRQTQTVQPWMFGHMETKATCLWLDRLPRLMPTNNVRAAMMLLPASERHRVHHMRPGPEREAERSRTFPGIADAMADQWANALGASLL